VPVLMSASRRREGEAHETQCIFLAVKRRSLFERHLEHLEALHGGAQPAAGSPASSAADGELAERMWTLGLLLAGIMHEVRNPLTYVQGNLQLLSADLESPDPATFDWESARESVKEASEGAERILELVRAVGTVSHVERSHPLPVDVARVVETAARLVRYRLSRVAKLELVGPTPGEVVLADEPRLVQVLMNLLVNAGQALETSRPVEPLIVVRHRTEGALALIDVMDNGPGIAEALRERVFQPFYTTKPLGEGTGLGLALSRQIINSFNGSLELAPSSGAGATFRIALPLAAP
jgi:signal transduction histidine kinase